MYFSSQQVLKSNRRNNPGIILMSILVQLLSFLRPFLSEKFTGNVN